jgi:hypothetical protein
MLLPDEGIRGNGEKLIVVGWGQGAKGHERPFQGRLKIEGQVGSPDLKHSGAGCTGGAPAP